MPAPGACLPAGGEAVPAGTCLPRTPAVPSRALTTSAIGQRALADIGATAATTAAEGVAGDGVLGSARCIGWPLDVGVTGLGAEPPVCRSDAPPVLAWCGVGFVAVVFPVRCAGGNRAPGEVTAAAGDKTSSSGTLGGLSRATCRLAEAWAAATAGTVAADVGPGAAEAGGAIIETAAGPWAWVSAGRGRSG